VALGDLEVREVKGAKLKLNVARFGNPEAVGEGLRDMAEKFLHLGGGLQVELVAAELHPLGVVNGGLGLDTEQDLVGLGIRGVEIMGVIGGNQRDAQLPAHINQLRVGSPLFIKAVILDFKVEAVLPKEALIVAGKVVGLLPLVLKD